MCMKGIERSHSLREMGKILLMVAFLVPVQSFTPFVFPHPLHPLTPLDWECSTVTCFLQLLSKKRRSCSDSELQGSWPFFCPPTHTMAASSQMACASNQGVITGDTERGELLFRLLCPCFLYKSRSFKNEERLRKIYEACSSFLK